MTINRNLETYMYSYRASSLHSYAGAPVSGYQYCSSLLSFTEQTGALDNGCQSLLSPIRR